MSLVGAGARVGVALVIAVAITATFAVTGLGAADVSIDVSNNQSAAPAPSSEEITPTGSPPDGHSDFPQFEDVSESVGFDYEPRVPTNVEMVDSGVYVADVDNDAYEDVLAVGEEHPTLFHNEGGTFEEQRTFEQERVRTAHFFDQDNDGDRDLVLGQYGGGFVFYENDGGTFTETDVGLDRQLLNPSSIVSADFTGNGCLDLFVSQNGLWSGTTPLTHAEAQQVAEEHPEVRPETQSGNPNLLYYGDCETFSDITDQAGIEGNHWTLTSSAADFTGDGFPDIHVGNDWSEDYVYENRGNGTFTRRGLGPNSDRNAMSSNPVDLTGDHALDLFVTNIYYPDDSTRTNRAPPINRDSAVPEGNNLFVNDGTGNFTDRAVDHGLEKGGWGWTATVADFNNDGHLDVVQSTTDVYWVEPYSRTFGSLQVWNGTPASWEKLDSTDYGLEQSNTYSVTRPDFDNDGNLDLIVGTAPHGPTLRENTQPFKVFENKRVDATDSLQLFLREPDVLERNAGVYVETDERVVYRSPDSGGNFQTQDSRMIHVGLGNERIERVTVLWPDGTTTEYTDFLPGNRYVLSQSGAEEVR